MVRQTSVLFNDAERIIGKKELKNLVLYSDTHIHRLEQDGRFPKRLKIGANRVGWLLSEVLEWIEQHKSKRDAAELNLEEDSQ